MKRWTMVAAISAGVVLLMTGLPAARQQDGIADAFRRYDKNGDGRVTRDEGVGLAMFDRWDTNKDGVVTLEEVTAFYRSGRPGGADPRPKQSARPTPGATKSADGFVPDAPFVGQPNGSYMDPEFDERTSQVVF